MKKEFTSNFSISPTLVKHLGRELYSADNSIIVELIANSYDADASEVEITIDRSATRSKIIIEDNGSGMSHETIEKKFLKAGNEDDSIIEKTPKGRKRLGAKGIGNLSMFAIGDKIKIETINSFPDSKNQEKIIFQLNYLDLIKKKTEVIILTEDVSSENTGTKISIHDLSSTIKQTNDKTYRKKIVTGISSIFSEILSNEKDKFSIKIKFIPSPEIDEVPCFYEIKTLEPDFSQTLIFFSLDTKTDSKINFLKNKSKDHLWKLARLTRLENENLFFYKNSNESWKTIQQKLFKNLKKNELIIENNLMQKFKDSIKGYVAAFVTDRNIDTTKKDQEIRSFDVNTEEKKYYVRKPTNKISVCSNLRVGLLNAKENISLADRLYQKYLFGTVHADYLVNANLKPGYDISLPSREGYRRHEMKWIFLKFCLEVLGNEAMSFSNRIANLKKTKDKKVAKRKIDKVKEEYLNPEKIPDKKTRNLIEKLLSSLVKWRLNSPYGKQKLIFVCSTNEFPVGQTVSHSKIMARKMEKILDVYIKKIKKENDVKIFYPHSEHPYRKLPKAKRYLLHLKEELNKSGFDEKASIYQENSHMFGFLNENFFDYFKTDVAYGIAFALSQSSGHSIPEDITLFTKHENLKKVSKGHVSDEELHIWNSDNLVERIKYTFNKFFGNEKDLILEKDIRQIVEKYID